jgi:Nuclease-related domain
MTWTQSLLLFVYLALFMGSIFAMIWWHKRQRKLRLPFGDDLKLQRAPGETQLMLVRKFDEEGFMWMMWAATAPATVGLVLLLGTLKLPRELQIIGVAVTLMAFIAVFIFSARWFARKAQESSNRYLGYFGERLVAEYLEPLKARGWRVFHDVPAIANGNKFNIDHIAVGPAGVFTIETKTRRKGAARPGFDDHKVYFDGHVLVWPWGEDSHGLEQTERNAVWLADTLVAEIGERFLVTPILTLPGWWVEMKPSREPRLCRVTNPKGLANFLSSGSAILTQDQIGSIAAKLEARCRDVEY